MLTRFTSVTAAVLFSVLSANGASAAAPAAKPTAKAAPATAAPAAKPAAKSAPPAAAQPVSLHEVEEKVIERTNAERARFGLRPLRIDHGLIRSARRHTAWMTNRRVLQHTSAPVAENIAMGQNSSDEVVRAWMNSSGHRANILNGGYTRIGVAAYRTNQGTTFWCQQFLR